MSQIGTYQLISFQQNKKTLNLQDKFHQGV